MSEEDKQRLKEYRNIIKQKSHPKNFLYILSNLYL